MAVVKKNYNKKQQYDKNSSRKNASFYYAYHAFYQMNRKKYVIDLCQFYLSISNFSYFWNFLQMHT